MTDRKVKVTLVAQIAEYKAAMGQAAKSTRDMGSEVDKLAASRQHFDMLGRSAVAAGGLIAVGLLAAVSKAAEFDQAMSAVQAATHESSENMKLLKDAAIEAGARTVYSAKQSANAIEELAKAGLSAGDILNGGLNGALDLAAAGGLDVAEAASIAAVTLKQFGLTGDKAAHVADLLAAGAGKAVGDVTDMGMALKQSGLVANQFGLSVEETTGALAAFASKGLLGSDAGTSFKTMLQRLVPQSKQAQEWMDALGLSAFDSAGNFIGLAEYAGKLETALKGMSEEQQNTTLSVLFGSDAVRGATVLLEEGQKGIQGWIDKVDDQGYAAETAAIRLDNLKGDIEQMGGAFDSLLISVGESGQGPLRGLVQGLTDLINTFNDMPEAGKQAVFWVGAVTSAVLLGGGVYLLAIPKIAAYNAAVATMSPTAQRASAALGRLTKVAGGVAIGAVAAVAGANLLSDAIRSLGDSAEAVQNSVKTASSATDLFTAAMNKAVSGSANFKAITANVENLGRVLDGENLGATLNTGILGNVGRLGDELAKLAETDVSSASQQFRLLAEQTQLTAKQQSVLLDKMPSYKKALVEQATANGDAADSTTLLKYAMGDIEASTDKNADALAKLAGQAGDTGEEVDKLSDQIRGFGSAQVDLEEASSNFQDAIDAATESLKENGKNLDLNEKKGRLNLAALREIRDTTLEKAAATKAATGSDEQAAKVIAEGREQLIKSRIAMGDSRKGAEAYADSLGLIPTNITTAAKLNTAQADEQMKEFRKKWKDFTVNVKAGGGGGRPEARATGGAITGPGTGTSDSIPALLSNGEHVWTAAEVAAAGGQGAMYAMRSAVRNGSWRAYASGGAVSSAAAATALPPIYVQNPFTGEYLLAKVDQRADGRIVQADAAASQALRRGNRGR